MKGIDLKALIGLSLKKAKEVAKKELNVKRMGEARFKMILDEGIKRGDFIVEDDKILSGEKEDFFDLEVIDVEEESTQSVEIRTKITHPPVIHLDSSLSSSDLPRVGDLYHYRSYSGMVVQGEVKSTICFAECQNPDGTWQSVAFQDLYIKKRGVPKETALNHLTAYYSDNSHLKSERDKLLREIKELKLKLKREEED